MLILKILAFCTLVSFTNFLGLYPQKDNMTEWLKDKSIIIKTMVYSYVFIVFVGWIHLIWAIWYFGFYK